MEDTAALKLQVIELFIVANFRGLFFPETFPHATAWGEPERPHIGRALF